MTTQSIQLFTEYLEDKGYSSSTINRYSKALAEVPDDWNTSDPRELYEHINDTKKAKALLFPPSVQHNLGPAASLWFLMMTGLSFKEYRKVISREESDYNDILSEFFSYSVDFKHMTIGSAEAERNHIQRFLESVGQIPNSWSDLSAEDLRNYVCESFSSLSTSSMGRYVTSLRNFFRFLEYQGEDIHPSVLKLPISPADWGKSKVPTVLSADEEERLRAHYSSVDSISVRNKLIVILMLDLGLRCSEVSGLKVCDILWDRAIICIRNSKTAQDRELPFTHDVGVLLEDYILNHRPKVPENHVFLRKVLKYQYTFMTRECIRGVIRRAFEEENIHGWWKGTHTLRRTAASRLFGSGNGLKITADMLGHGSLDSTRSYVRVDFDNLRQVTFPWPGGV